MTRRRKIIRIALTAATFAALLVAGLWTWRISRTAYVIVLVLLCAWAAFSLRAIWRGTVFLVRYRRGRSLIEKGMFTEAAHMLTRAIDTRCEEGQAAAYACRGYAYCRLEEYRKAVQDFSRAIELDPCDALAYLNRGDTYQTLGEYDKAVADASRAIELNPDEPDAYNNRAAGYCRKGQHELARRDVAKCHSLGGEVASYILELLGDSP